MLHIMPIIKPALTRQVFAPGYARAAWESSRLSFTSHQAFNCLKE
ncbi:MAG: hypothetical protein R3B04_04125 [Nitrospira sp.]